CNIQHIETECALEVPFERRGFRAFGAQAVACRARLIAALEPRSYRRAFDRAEELAARVQELERVPFRGIVAGGDDDSAGGGEVRADRARTWSWCPESNGGPLHYE